jgi:RAB6A-GEF complex partner protein 1
MDDRVLVYRGADQPDMSVINPESDVWQHIKVSLWSRMIVTLLEYGF